MADTQLSELKFFDDMRVVCIHIIFKIATSRTFFGKEAKDRDGLKVTVNIKNIWIELRDAVYYITLIFL